MTAIGPESEAIVGTDALGRALTDEEKRRFGRVLRKYDYPGQRLVALRFAMKLTRSRTRAQDLMGRADLRLVRSGWDPGRVPLVRCLCRLVWSEWTHEVEASETARVAAEGFLNEESAHGRLAARTPEDRAAEIEHEQERHRHATARLSELREAFVQAGDEVNLLYLDYASRGIEDLAIIAKESGRDVTDLYDAAKRRKRAVQKLIAARAGLTLVKDG